MFHANGSFFTTTPWWLFWVLLGIIDAVLILVGITLVPWLWNNLWNNLRAKNSRLRAKKG